MRRLLNKIAVVLVAFGVTCASTLVGAQWLKYPSAGVPRFDHRADVTRGGLTGW
jgi:hypothetical protein